MMLSRDDWHPDRIQSQGVNFIIINYKTYYEGYGKRGLELTKSLERIAKEYDAGFAVAVQPTDIKLISESTDVPVLAQHIDCVGYGSFTGSVLAEAVKEAGAVGTLINHSEFRLRLADIYSTIERAKGSGMSTIVCTDNVHTSGSAASLNPHFIAIEPPELIGGDISVSKAKPEVVKGSVDAVKRVNHRVIVLCGAGVKDKEDVRRAVDLGAKGVLLASGVVKAKRPEEVMRDLMDELCR